MFVQVFVENILYVYLALVSSFFNILYPICLYMPCICICYANFVSSQLEVFLLRGLL